MGPSHRPYGVQGSWLALWLTQLGAQVYGVALTPGTSPALFEQLGLSSRLAGHYLYDISDLGALSAIADDCQPHVVFHLAAQPLVRRSYCDPLGTWATNVQGSLNLLEALKGLQHTCAVFMVPTDIVYADREWAFGYRGEDRLGGHDPYSANEAAAELAIDSWRSSFVVLILTRPLIWLSLPLELVTSLVVEIGQKTEFCLMQWVRWP